MESEMFLPLYRFFPWIVEYAEVAECLAVFRISGVNYFADEHVDVFYVALHKQKCGLTDPSSFLDYFTQMIGLADEIIARDHLAIDSFSIGQRAGNFEFDVMECEVRKVKVEDSIIDTSVFLIPLLEVLNSLRSQEGKPPLGWKRL